MYIQIGIEKLENYLKTNTVVFRFEYFTVKLKHLGMTTNKNNNNYIIVLIFANYKSIKISINVNFEVVIINELF